MECILALKYSLGRSIFFVLFIVGEESPLHSHFILKCAMSFKVEGLGLEVICRDHFKEFAEGI